ncbi:MAG: TonB-dependent receptor [Ideonella sp.]|nr:TonB-dependent receptor [Ideonella sp.]
MLGVELQNDHQQGIALGPVGEPPWVEFVGKNRRLGLFIQDEWQISDAHHLILGLRHDQDQVGRKQPQPQTCVDVAR